MFLWICPRRWWRKQERQEGRENIYINVRFLGLLTSDRNDFKKFV